MVHPKVGVGTLARSALGRERISPAAIGHTRGMNEKRGVLACRKGIDEHECIVQPELLHGACAVEGASTIREVIVGLKQTATASAYVLYDELVAAIRQSVYDGVAIARVELPYQLMLAHWLQLVVYRQCEEQFAAFGVVYSKRTKRGQQVDAVVTVATELD